MRLGKTKQFRVRGEGSTGESRNSEGGHATVEGTRFERGAVKEREECSGGWRRTM